MAGKSSKTNRTGRVDRIGAQKSHFCPTCDEPSKLSMRWPGRAMWGTCEAGHYYRKSALILK